jgi:hypothetical protein
MARRGRMIWVFAIASVAGCHTGSAAVHRTEPVVTRAAQHAGDASVPTCPTADLRVISLGGQALEQQSGIQDGMLAFFRTGVSPCALRGHPTVQPLTPHGRRMPVRYENLHTGLFSRARRLLVPPLSAERETSSAQTAKNWVVVDMVSWGNYSNGYSPCPPDYVLRSFVIRPPAGGVLKVASASGYSPMDACKGIFQTSNFERPLA